MPSWEGRGEGLRRCGCGPRPQKYDQEPDQNFFVRLEGRWRLRAAALVGWPPADAGADVGADALRDAVARWTTAEAEDQCLLAAAATGGTASQAFADIVDGGGLTREVCFCCCAAPSAAAAREAARALSAFRRYYSPLAYIQSRAFPRAVAAMTRDLSPGELDEVKAFIGSLDSTPDAIREINSSGLPEGEGGGVCVAMPRCRPGTLWVYSSPGGRALIRHVESVFPHLAALEITASLEAFPRHRYRLFEVGPGQNEAAGSLLEAALAWVRRDRKEEGGGGPWRRHRDLAPPAKRLSARPSAPRRGPPAGSSRRNGSGTPPAVW